jgi:uncharacterized iron-regulated protein
VCVAAGLLATTSIAAAADRIYTLKIGDPARRDKTVAVATDTIVDTRTGETIVPAQLAERLKDTRLLLVGETHTSTEAHRVQLRVIKALAEAGRDVLIGLEMFPYTEQASLDQWIAGSASDADWVKSARWYEHWGYHWEYYRDIFAYARTHQLPMFAVNSPRDVVTAVRRKGFANLTPEEAAHIPTEVDVDSEDHMTFFKASFGDGDAMHGGMSPDAWKGMLSAQATWDATMGWNAVKALEKRGGPKAIMVVLVGSGHVAYGVGIERQARRWFDGEIRTLVPVPVRDDKGPIGEVAATYADIVWGVAYEDESRFPTTGISTRADAKAGLRQVIMVERDSPAARAGVAVGDYLVSLDGTPVPDRETMNVVMAGKTWGDTATLVVKRGDQELPLTLAFKRK